MIDKCILSTALLSTFHALSVICLFMFLAELSVQQMPVARIVQSHDSISAAMVSANKR